MEVLPSIRQWRDACIYWFSTGAFLWQSKTAKESVVTVVSAFGILFEHDPDEVAMQATGQVTRMPDTLTFPASALVQ